MRHKCGDIIRPGDCVLLRAGSKKNELPYVAKVASLWETPEDGKTKKLFLHFVVLNIKKILFLFQVK